MQGFGGGSRAASVGVLPRADSVAAARGGGGGRLGGAMSRPGTAKLGKFGSSCNVFGTSKPKFECLQRLTIATKLAALRKPPCY